MTTLQNRIHPKSSSVALFVPPESRPVSYAALEKLTAGFRSFLASLELERQSAIAIVLPNSLEFVTAFLGSAYSGFISCPLNPALKQSEFEFYLQDLAAPVVIVPAGSPESLPAIKAARKIGSWVRVFGVGVSGGELDLHPYDKAGTITKNAKIVITEAQKEDVAMILHTSGTTGRPKIVPLTHANLTASMANIAGTYKLTPADRGLLVMPLFHVHGLMCGLLAPLSVGSPVIVPARFSASQFWDDFNAYKADWYTAVPTIHQILLKNPPEKVPEIRFIRSCSSPLAEAIFHKLEKTFNAPVLEAYAMTEAAHQMTSNLLPPGQRKPGSVGIGHGVDVRVLDQDGNEVAQGTQGEICIRGANVTAGYRSNAEANASSFTKSGFFRTGDQGKIDEDGFLYITGRIKEMIDYGGEHISPSELDGVLLSHPDVSEAVVFGVPSEMYGQEVEAAVVLAQGKKPTEKELLEFVASKVAKFKVPKRIYFTDQIPKSATGKVNRKNVADAFAKKSKL